MDQEPDYGDEPLDPPTEEEQRAEAWEYWHQRTLLHLETIEALEKENARLKEIVRVLLAQEGYQPRDDLAKSIDACYEAIRERVAAGGETWKPPK